ncbi:hypothetical protein [Streptomyces bohaiensis]|uniref:Secreted protein n=1 Tax=Streptomyces bohaiensis TaxID=1431344 RepID=A0ABX1CDR7_9ACTN|nr:hypothetical protein [Streptomyces bohaiensis]NJQ14464.1 hypothetical protein [Streptomyces bohaiensis]
MSAISLILMLAAGLALAVCTAALWAARGLRAEVTALRALLAPALLPPARVAPDEELIRAAVADALADERDRELAEARAFWAEQEARDAENAAMGHHGSPASSADEMLLDALLERYLAEGDATGADGSLLGGGEFGALGPDVDLAGYDPHGYDAHDAAFGIRPARPVVPRQGTGREDADFFTAEHSAEHSEDAPTGRADESSSARDRRTGEERGQGEYGDAAPRRPFLPRQATGDVTPAPAPEPRDEDDQLSAEMAAARRRHPSHPGYSLSGEPVELPGQACEPGHDAAVEEYERTTERLGRLARAGTPLADVRPGPLGTLDVFLFEDGTTLCLSPGHRETSQRLASAVRAGESPVLLGGSGVSGAYALTFACGEESIYLLADRIVAA